MGQGNETSRRRVGARLRTLRERLGVSRTEAARRAGISRFQLGSFERGHRRVPDAAVASLARTYGVTLGEVVPSRSQSRLKVTHGEVAAGEARRALPSDASPDDVLDEYVDLIRDLRHAETLENLPLRDADLEVLANALGSTPEEIEERLVELIHCTAEEARAIRRTLLKRRLVVPTAGFMLGMGGLGSAYAAAGAGLSETKGPGAPVVSSETVERARTVELDMGSPSDPADPSDPAPADPAPPAPESEPATDDGASGSAGSHDGSEDEVTRYGEGEEWAELIPPVVITPDDPGQ